MSFRHIADIYRPSEALGSRGGKEGADQLLVSDWPCEVTQLGGTEVEQAGATFADLTFEAVGRDPGVAITPKDYLVWQKRRLEITSITEPVRIGMPLVLACGGAV